MATPRWIGTCMERALCRGKPGVQLLQKSTKGKTNKEKLIGVSSGMRWNWQQAIVDVQTTRKQLWEMYILLGRKGMFNAEGDILKLCLEVQCLMLTPKQKISRPNEKGSTVLILSNCLSIAYSSCWLSLNWFFAVCPLGTSWWPLDMVCGLSIFGSFSFFPVFHQLALSSVLHTWLQF